MADASRNPSSNSLPPAKKWLFRFLVAVVIPVASLAALEWALRWSGYGYTTSFFIPSPKIPGKLQENPAFGWQFFPKNVARAPFPFLISPQKPPQTIRIFVLGESAARGEPEPAFGFGRALGALLTERFPGHAFEIVNTSITAINSHVILPIARDCARLDSDYWVVYMGNNEVMGPFGPNTVFGGKSQNLSALRASLALKRLRVGQWLSSVLRPGNGSQSTNAWEGMEMFLNQETKADDPALNSVYHAFQSNLKDILHAAQGASGSPEVFLCTVGVNLKDLLPLASSHGSQWNPDQSAAFESSIAQARNALSRSEFTNALDAIQKAIALDAQYADLPFLQGKAWLGLGNIPKSLEAFQQACDLDTLRFRTDSRENHLIRETAAQFPNKVHLVDVARALNEQAPEGIAGDPYFYEHVHFKFAGDYRVARLLAESVAQRLQAREPNLKPREWLTEADCAARLGLTDWHRLEMLKNMAGRLSQPPFTRAGTNPAVAGQSLRLEIGQLQGAGQPAAYERQNAILQKALAQSPNDWVLQDQNGRFQAAFRRFDQASNAWSQVLKEAPQHALAWYQMGSLLNDKATAASAEPYFREALRLRPEIPEIHHDYALCLGFLRRMTEAEQELLTALQLRPKYSEAHLSLGTMLAQRGDIDGAIEHYRISTQLTPRNLNSKAILVRMLMSKGRGEEASNLTREMLTLQPSNTTIRSLLVDALYTAHNTNDALKELQTMVQMDPTSAATHNRLAIELAARGELAEAESHFNEIVLLRPEDPLARLNLGKFFLDQGRFAPAEEQFKEAVRLQPTNSVATNFLKQAQQKRQGATSTNR